MTENVTFALEESIDISVVEKLHERLSEVSPDEKGVRIGASSVSRVDTAAFQLLYSYQQAMEAKEFPVVFVNPSTTFMENATLLGMHEVLHIEQ
ncbi:hypothetical protein A9Q99_08300 [Gammaproteobacteria bacterium 45_16_T64]|nr:hypothetical protein A9Q99_08300 [Gammaproteobacteria bacterium 45_16_T64]